jgi:hypothetical protein
MAAGSDKFGQVTDAKLKIWCLPLKPAHFDNRIANKQCNYYGVCYGEPKVTLSPRALSAPDFVFLDEDPAAYCGEVVYMMVARICEFVTEGLVLVPTAKAKGQFMRIGIFWVGNNNKNL